MAQVSEVTRKASKGEGFSRRNQVLAKIAELLYKVPDPVILVAAACLAQTEESKSVFIAAGLIGMVVLEELI